MPTRRVKFFNTERGYDFFRSIEEKPRNRAFAVLKKVEAKRQDNEDTWQEQFAPGTGESTFTPAPPFSLG